MTVSRMRSQTIAYRGWGQDLLNKERARDEAWRKKVEAKVARVNAKKGVNDWAEVFAVVRVTRA